MKKRPVDSKNAIDEIQVSLSKAKLELQAYSALFMSLGTASLQAEDLKGISLIFDRIIETIDDTNRTLNEIYSAH